MQNSNICARLMQCTSIRCYDVRCVNVPCMQQACSTHAVGWHSWQLLYILETHIAHLDSDWIRNLWDPGINDFVQIRTFAEKSRFVRFLRFLGFRRISRISMISRSERQSGQNLPEWRSGWIWPESLSGALSAGRTKSWTFRTNPHFVRKSRFLLSKVRKYGPRCYI